MTEKEEAAFTAAKWLSLDFVLINVLNRPREDIAIIHRDIKTFVDLYTKRRTDEIQTEPKHIRSPGSDDPAPGPLSDGISSEEAMSRRRGEHLQRDFGTGDDRPF